MPFSLTNAPAVFQAMINDILCNMLNHFVFVYLDDILILSRTLDEHTEQVRLMLQGLLENKLFVKHEKCEFHSAEVSFLGFVTARGRLQLDPPRSRQWKTGPQCPPVRSCSVSWVLPTSTEDLSRITAES